MKIRSTLKKVSPKLFSLLRFCKEKIYLWIGHISPCMLIKILYKSYYGMPINLKDPQDIDEKVNYMKLFSDTSLWSLCADKYEVREYVKRCGLGYTLNDLYGLYETPEDIDFDSLPNQFVIKTTNGGGGNSVMIVKDKTVMDKKSVITTLHSWLKIPMGYKYAELHYNKIPPRLLVEKYIECESNQNSLVDYKFNCFNGSVYSIFLCSDRQFGKKVNYSVYDLEWNLYPEKIKPAYATDEVFPRPQSLDLMIKYSSILSQGIPYVRVDWYEVNGKPVFGEMTFTPAGGFQQFYSDDYRRELGRQCHIVN